MDRRVHGGLRPARLVWIAALLLLMASAVNGVRVQPGSDLRHDRREWNPDRRLLVPAQARTRVKELAAGKILVARRELLDPNFAESVVLLVQYDEKGTVGLIINRKTKVPISRLAKELETAKGRTDPLYLGGPVETTGLMALLKSATKPEDAKHVFGDIYMISSKATLEKTMASPAAPNAFRLYVGYAGWGAGQLEAEVAIDAWEVLPANAGMVFDLHPESLWRRLAEEEGLQIAALRQDAIEEESYR
jgi:putative AlgH/UPF0301 family transcriptional regulator